MEYVNPIIPGFAPDPSMVLVNGTFYLATSSFHLYPGIPIHASRNLREWTHIGNAIHRPEQLSLRHGSTMSVPLHSGGSMLGCGGLFAPTIRHREGRFYIICTNARTTPTFGVDNFYVWTDDIWNGPWSDPVPFPFRGIDPSLVFENGRAYVQGSFSLGMGKHPSATIKQFEIDIDTSKLLSEPKEIWGGHSQVDTEGPHIYKRGEYYYLLVAEGGTFEHHSLSIARSKDIWGPYESFSGNPLLTSDGKPDEHIQNVGHGELVEDAAGRWWAVVLGVRKTHGSHPLGRETFLAPVDWPKGGWPSISQPKTAFTAPLAVPCIDAGEASAQKAFVEKLTKVPHSLGYAYIRDPELARYKLPGPEGGPIMLRPSLEDFSRPTGTSTFVGKRQTSLEASTEAVLDLSRLRRSDPELVVGLAVYKHHPHHISLRYDASAGVVTFRGVNHVTSLSRDSGPLFAVDERAGLLRFRIEASPTEYRGFVADDINKELVDLGRWETKAFRANEMTGPIMGIFAHSPREGDEAGQVVFTDFEVRAWS